MRAKLFKQGNHSPGAALVMLGLGAANLHRPSVEINIRPAQSEKLAGDPQSGVASQGKPAPNALFWQYAAGRHHFGEGDGIPKEYIIFCDESERDGKYYSNFYGGLVVGSSHYESVTDRLGDREHGCVE